MLHRAGSLDIAVSHARLRNLLVSFGVLLLLGASMGLVLVTTGRAQRLAAQQMEFVAGVSHELRTPLAVIRSAAENLADGVVSDPKQVKRYGDVIAGEGRRLTQMVEQIMEFAGFESGRATLDVRPAELGGIIEDALRSADPLVREHHATIEQRAAADLPAVLVDPSAVSRSLQNLIVNALKYGGAPPAVVVEARPCRRLPARGRRHHQRQRRRHRRPRPAAHLRAVLSRRRRHRATDPRQRPRPEPGQADHGRTGRAHHGAHRRRQGQRLHAAPAAGAGRGAGRRAGGASGGGDRPRQSARAGVSPRASPGAHDGGAPGDFTLVRAELKLAHDATDVGQTVGVARILIVEDEPGLVLTLSDRLGREGHVVEAATNGRDGLARASQEPFDLLLLDVMLPGLGGFDILRDLRQQGVETPVIMLTARGQVIDKVLGLKLGADDYLTKPFEMMELLARIEARLRRDAPKDTVDADAYRFGAVQVDFRKAEVTRDGQPVELSAREYQLLRYFIEHRGATISRDELLNHVWGYHAMPNTRTVDVHVAWLRQKIEPNPKHPQYVITAHGLVQVRGLTRPAAGVRRRRRAQRR